MILEFENISPCISISFSFGQFKSLPYGEAYKDMEKMFYNELVSLLPGIILKDDSIPCIRANYGVGSLASLFGVSCSIVNNSMPWVEPYSGIEQIKHITENGIPDLNAGLGRKIIETYEYYNEVLKKYPKCYDSIMIYHPDMQGPFDILHLICGNNVYYWMYDEPDLIHNMLDIICETYIAFMNRVKPLIRDEYEDCYCAHFNSLWGGKIVLRDDTAVNLSPDQYKEFVRPYDEKLLTALGGGSIHYCGRAPHIEKEFFDTAGLLGLNYGHMPNHQFGEQFLKTIYPVFFERKIPLINYILEKKEITDFHIKNYFKGVSYQCYAENVSEAHSIMNQFKSFI